MASKPRTPTPGAPERIESPLRNMLRDAEALLDRVNTRQLGNAECEGEVTGLISSALLKGRPVTRALRNSLAELLRIHPEDWFRLVLGPWPNGSTVSPVAGINALEAVVVSIAEAIAADEDVDSRISTGDAGPANSETPGGRK